MDTFVNVHFFLDSPNIHLSKKVFWRKTKNVQHNFSPVSLVIRKVQENKVGLKLNGTHQLLVSDDDDDYVNILGNNIYHECPVLECLKKSCLD
jgi:hypothetical protein